MRLLFLFLSMLPSASALSTEAALVLPKGAPTTRLSASRPSLAARVPSVCGRDCRRHAPATMRRDDSLIRQSTGLGLGPDGGEAVEVRFSSSAQAGWAREWPLRYGSRGRRWR